MTVLNNCPFGSPLQLFCIYKAVMEGRTIGGAAEAVVVVKGAGRWRFKFFYKKMFLVRNRTSFDRASDGSDRYDGVYNADNIGYWRGFVPGLGDRVPRQRYSFISEFPNPTSQTISNPKHSPPFPALKHDLAQARQQGRPRHWRQLRKCA